MTSVTIALCTFDRAPLLRRSLESYRALRLPPGVTAELLVVNNNCTDATDEVLREFRALPLRRLFEPRPGKAIAANLATEEARGDLLVWTDDDVLVDPGWIAAYVEAAARHPGATLFGGPVRPWFEEPPPPWLERGLPEAALAYALLDLGPEERPLRGGERFNGPNFAIRMEAAKRYRRDERFGPRPTDRVVGEESALQGAMIRDGHRAIWVPSAVVSHFIPAASMTLRHIAYRYRLHGRSLAMGIRGRARRLGAGLRSGLSLLLEAGPRYLLGRALRLPEPLWIRAFRRAQTHRGRLSGLLRPPR
jgi:glycosyltransferase involved in cell wall biosynthesis